MIPSLQAAVLLPPVRDPDARDYIRRVAAADGQPLEPLVQRAIDAFVRGCKSDGTWNAIKASCILSGARTLSGALVPLVGTAPTNFNFVAGDYNRETGLQGDGSTKYLNSNRAGNADPQNNSHVSILKTVQATVGNPNTNIGTSVTNSGCTSITNSFRSRSSDFDGAYTPAASFLAISRSNANDYQARAFGATSTYTRASQSPEAANFLIAARINPSAPDFFTNSRFAFYSIGESLDLALLDARVTDLINAIGAAL